MQHVRPDVCVNFISGSSCWTCEDRGVRCDETLPVCHECLIARIQCSGYSARVEWPQELLRTIRNPPARTSTPLSTSAFSSLGLPAAENHLALHFMKNITKLALAIDYHGNGYRKFARMALHDPAILNALLAVACSHLSKWRRKQDTESRVYLRKAVSMLQQRFRTPKLVRNEATVVIMLLLSTYEVFNGTNKWRHHYDAISGWLRAFGATADLDPFLKTWITLMETQSGLNRGVARIPLVADWSSLSSAWQPQGYHTIDPFLGFSGKLPRLMIEAAQLYASSQTADRSNPTTTQDLHERSEKLQAKIRACAIPFSASETPLLAVTCCQGEETVMAVNDFTEPELNRRATATAEIFRHSMHVYVHRITNDPTQPLPDDIQTSLDTVFELLQYVPDAFGPGANLGWALVVVGSEIDDEDRREYIRCRWRVLEVLGLGNTSSGAKLLEDVWVARDDARTFGWALPRWQTIMHDSSSEMILL